MALRGPGLGCIEESWDNDCFVYHELCIHADVAVLEYSCSQSVEGSHSALLVMLNFILNVNCY